MTSTLSKRHQVRNEKTLQELIKTVPGNDRCADCGARNPGWASWSLGIFLCMRCASLHRKLGTHISKVKSLSLDSWSNEQVDHMKRTGNANANRTYNPQNTKPPIPLDVDEVDAVLERFIRQKYDQQLFSNSRPSPVVRNNSGSRSSEDQPPPLPPKPTKRFGFGLRSSSSTVPSARSTVASPPESPRVANGWGNPPPVRVNKQSRVFGATVGGGGDDTDSKLAQLREMGFMDEKRNLNILKGLGGNLERTIESLIRLGEGSGNNSRSRTPLQPRPVAVSQPLPPTVPSTGVVNGISIIPNETPSQAITQSTTQQRSQSTVPHPTLSQEQTAARGFSVGNPYNAPFQSYNPFVSSTPQSPNPSLEASFGGLQISTQSQPQPLFPNATGGYPVQPHPMQDTRFQTMTPPVPQLPQQFSQSNPFARQSQAPNGNYFPSFQTAQQTTAAPANQYQPPQLFSNSYNPFQQPSNNPSSFQAYPDSPQTYSPFTQQGSFQPQPFGQQQQSPQQLQQPELFSQQHSMTDPTIYARESQHHQQQQQAPQQFPQYQPQPLQPQQTGRIDKTSILALYNYPHLAPQPPLNHATYPPNNNNNNNNNTATEPPSPIHSSNPAAPTEARRSSTMPIQLASRSKNPFQASAAGNGITNGTGFSRHISQESADVHVQNGRHSPDAFASLSARFLRPD